MTTQFRHCLHQMHDFIHKEIYIGGNWSNVVTSLTNPTSVDGNVPVHFVGILLTIKFDCHVREFDEVKMFHA